MPPNEASAPGPATPAFAPTPRTVNVVLGMMLITMVINSVDRTILSILVQDIKLDLDLSDRQLGLLLGPAFTIFYTLATFPLAAWADMGRRRTVIAVGLFFWSLFTLGTAWAKGFWSLFAFRMLVGIGEASSTAPGQSLLMAYVPVARRARAMSMIAIGSVLGLAIGMMMGGWISEWRGWRMAFVIAGLPGLVFAFIFYFSVREAPQSEKGVPWREVRRTMFAIRTYRWVLAAQSMALFASMGRNLWEPTFLRRVYEMGAGEAGTWYFLTSPLPSAFGIYFGGWLVDRLRRRDGRWMMWVPTFGQIVSLPFLLGFLMWPETSRLSMEPLDPVLRWLPFLRIDGGFPVALLFSIVGSVFGSFYAAPMLAVTQTLAPVVMRARAAALAGALSAVIGHGLGPTLVCELNERLAPQYGELAIRYSLVVVVIAALISAFLWFGASRPLRGDLERRAASGPE